MPQSTDFWMQTLEIRHRYTKLILPFTRVEIGRWIYRHICQFWLSLAFNWSISSDTLSIWGSDKSSIFLFSSSFFYSHLETVLERFLWKLDICFLLGSRSSATTWIKIFPIWFRQSSNNNCPSEDVGRTTRCHFLAPMVPPSVNWNCKRGTHTVAIILK